MQNYQIKVYLCTPVGNPEKPLIAMVSSVEQKRI
jgi:hypothetical protein